LFPFLENIATIQISQWNEESGMIMLQVLKCFFMSNYLQYENYFLDQVLMNWMIILKTVVDRPMKPELTALCSDWAEVIEREK
jgi:hypothetical protein